MNASDDVHLVDDPPVTLESQHIANPPTHDVEDEEDNEIPQIYADFITEVFENEDIEIEESPPPQVKLSNFTLEGIAKYIKEENPKICFMVGAGISTSAGIPDFRTPGTGLYDNLGKYDLDDPQDIFDLQFFDEDPRPFYTLAKELFPTGVKPTTCHYFIKLVDEKGLLKRCFTQNIDSLERIANIPSQKVVFAHGNHITSTCRVCKKKYNYDWLQAHLADKNKLVPFCEEENCNGVVKPDIVFFGENLPTSFFLGAIHDIPACDLLIIMGTSLVVHPFASIVHEVRPEVPRLLINMAAVGKKRNPFAPSLMYGEPNNIRDVFWPGACDDGVMELARLLGWDEELKDLIHREHLKLENKAQYQKNLNTLDSGTGDSVAGPSTK